MVYCLVLGEHPREAFEVEIDRFNSISKLRDIIWEKNKDIAPSSRKPRLWKVDISNEENEKIEKLEILINTPPHEINIEKQLEGKELFTNKDLGDYFPVPILDRHIRIIVQPPLSPATTEEERLIKRQKLGDPIFGDLLEIVAHLKKGTNYQTSQRKKTHNDWTYIADAAPLPRLTAKTVVAVSPISYLEDKMYEDFAKVDNIKFCMPPWTLNELKFCRECTFSHVPEDLMMKLFDKTGGVPRYVLEMPGDLVKQHKTLSDEIIEEIVGKSIRRIEDAFLKNSRPSNAREIMFEIYVLNIFKHGGNFEIKFLQETEIMISLKHTIKQNELVKTVENMPVFKNGNKIRLFFVVPDDIYDDYKYQNYVTSRNDKVNYQDEVDDEDPNDLMFRPVKRTSSVLNSVEQWVLKIDLSL
ncbi:hypothetical protein C1645_739830 [Glomus cerebriforme]|uniref:Crinkler effector protein N-terminal domain-containing protein n=1 Tax=Glomus cerebriforme TaxID=658196 RepID=A0A397SVC5_9GLOM|nr:hypothetical protein C1645_739830 [Glomus cerebriforme]